MLLALATGKLSDISVSDVGLDGITVADGLAVGRASKLTTSWMIHLIDGVFTVLMSSCLTWYAGSGQGRHKN